MITDDAVRERHGVTCRRSGLGGSFPETAVNVWEGDEYVHLSACTETRQMTAWQARYLASKLYRLSRRIRQRTETTT